MSILIKGIEMPKTGVYVLSVDNTGKDKTVFAIAEHTYSGKIIPCYVCEAVPVLPHGRLIDADEFLKRAIGTQCFKGVDALMLEELIGESTIIIPAEGGK